MSWDLLNRFIESDVFNQNPFLSVAYLSRYADHVGITYVLCSKLRQFSYEEIEFFLPQLCHLVVSLNNDSMALEEFILDLCEESVNGALLTFWLFQGYLYDLSTNPHSSQFKTCRRIYNKVQHIVFGVTEVPRIEKIHENVLPTTVLATFVLASIGMPMLPRWAGPLAISQARKPAESEETVSDASQTQKLSRSHTVGGSPEKRRRRPRTTEKTAGSSGSRLKPERGTIAPRAASFEARPVSSSSPKREAMEDGAKRPSHLLLQQAGNQMSTASLPLPDIRTPTSERPTTPKSGRPSHRPDHPGRRHTHHPRPLSPSVLTARQKGKLLRQNYFRCETQFLQALEGISNRLVMVPKPARLSALRAELALIAQDLPAEVDIPVICPATLVDGIPSKSKHHRIVRLNPTECTVLNSAEKVPYLLMVEVLREDFTFDPETPENEELVKRLMAEQGHTKKRIFDLSDAPRSHPVVKPQEAIAPDSVFEPAQGDLGSAPITPGAEIPGTNHAGAAFDAIARTASPATTQSTAHSSSSSHQTPRTSAATSTSDTNSPALLRKVTLPLHSRPSGQDQNNFSALATHIRAAAQMLQQLDNSTTKRPRAEVDAIRAKIIASMQSLEEQSFDANRSGSSQTFDSMMANAAAASDNVDEEDLESLTLELVQSGAGAGAARTENDMKTGGVQRRGDRDDPSAATVGEDWNAKKERIRRASPYGWMPNWDLLSVIVKTGADLRQEAFAVQLIQVCDKIWQEAGTPVWVKRMRILITGESSGLIETITNGVSLHSIKRSLTLSTLEAGSNPRGRIASLKDHFLKAFGEESSETYKTAQKEFGRSLAAYSMISYILQLKDRHNGNVLIDNEGHIVHIDFGFMLSNSPGSVGFEAAPFKLTWEYVDVLGGTESEAWREYVGLCKKAFQALRRSADNIIDLVSLMGKDSKMPCFSSGGPATTQALKSRFQLQLSAEEAERFVESDLVGKSLGSYYTRLYDTFQYRTQGIY